MDENKLAYYNGFSDGLYACNMALIALLDGTAKLKDSKTIKLLIAETGKTLANLMDETSNQIESFVVEKEK